MANTPLEGPSKYSFCSGVQIKNISANCICMKREKRKMRKKESGRDKIILCLPICLVSDLLNYMMSAYLYTWCLPICMIPAYLYDCFWISDFGLIRYRLNLYPKSQSDIRMVRYRIEKLNIGYQRDKVQYRFPPMLTGTYFFVPTEKNFPSFFQQKNLKGRKYQFMYVSKIIQRIN
jgi:hypothetical protein